MTEQEQHEFDKLITSIVDETMTPEQTAQLQRQLAESSAARERFVLEMGLHGSLYGYAAEAEHEKEVDSAAPEAGLSPWRKRIAPALRLITRPTPFSLTVATLVIGVLVSTMAYFVVPIYHARQQERIAKIDAKRIVAQLTRVQDAQWVEGQVGAIAGAQLVAGHQMELERGLAEVKFHDGAVVLLEGPARLRVGDTGEATLLAGRIRAQVPQAAVGFKVTTPVMEIVDLGTEFGVGVDSREATEVQVLKGSVAIAPVGQASPGERVVLRAGQAWKIEASGGPGHAVASSPQRFNMKIVDPQVVVLQAGRVNAITGGTYEGVEDAQLLQWGPDNNFGARADFDVGQLNGQRAHTLLRFDLSSLAGKVDRLLSVTLRIQPHDDVFYFPWKGEGRIELYRLSDASASWREGTGVSGGRPIAGVGEPTWNHLNHRRERWPGAGGASKAGIDYNAGPLAAAAYVSRTGYPLDFHLSGDLEFIRGWIEGQPNSGFLLRETTGKPHNRINFHSSESTSAAARPQLIVTYLPKSEDDDGSTESHNP